MFRTTRFAGIGIILAMVAMVAATAPVLAGGQLAGTFGGESWATRANAVSGDIAIKLGRSAYQPCPCLGTHGAIYSNSVDSIRAGQAFQAAAAMDTAQADKLSDMTAYAITVSEITDVRALDGLITADLIRARAETRATATGFTTSTKGSRILGLRIAGQPITVVAGRRVNLAGFGYVILKSVKKGGDGVVSRSIQVEMLRIVIKQTNPLDIPVGTRIIVGHARAAYSRTEPVGLVGGAAWAADATSNVATVENRVGKAAAVYLGCFGKGDVTRTNNVEVISAPGLLITGTGETSIRGAVNASRALAVGKSRIEQVDLLDGFITADVIEGVSRTKRTAAGIRTASFQGSHFVNLRVAGILIGDDVAPNTELLVPGVGRVVLYETQVTTTPSQIKAIVTMVHLYVNTVNTLGLPVGTELRLAYTRTHVDTP
ncbi:MAG: choice-of-anchor P family protein [Candidatus Limnocylindrales bacterium]